MFADLAELSRNRPAGEERHTELGCTARASTSTPTCRASTSSGRPARAVPRPARPGARPLRRRRPRPHPRAGGGGLPDLPGPAADRRRRRGGRPRCCGGGSPSRRPPASCASRRGSCWSTSAAATQLRFPVVGDLARSVVFRWFGQPLLRRKRAEVLRRRPRRPRRLAGDPDAPTAPSGSTRWWPSPSRWSGFLASGSSGGADHGRCWRCWPRRHYRECDLHDVQSVEAGGRPFFVAEYARDDRPTRLVVDRRHGGRARRRRRRRWPRRRRRRRGRARGTTAVADLYLHWSDAPERPTSRERAARDRWSRRCRSPRDVRRITVAVCAGGSRPVATITFRPADRRRGRGPPHPRPAPADRPAAATCGGCASSTSPGSRRRRGGPALPVRRPGSNPADERLVAMAQVRDLAAAARRRRPDRSRCPRRRARWTRCLDAIRRVRAARGPRASGSTPTASGSTSGRRASSTARS